MTRPSTVTTAQITRAVKGAQAAGLAVGRVEIDPRGKIVLHVAGNQPEADGWINFEVKDATEALAPRQRATPAPRR